MTELIISLIAGFLTVLAPCVLPVLPVLIGGSVGGKNRLRPLFIVFGLVSSIFVFTLTLKVSTSFIGVPQYVWSFLSGSVFLIFGFFSLFPEIWDNISLKFGFSSKSDKILEEAEQKETWYGPILVGAALGPVFSSCSPTFSILVFTVIKQDFFWGILNIIVYLIGLTLVLLPIAFLGQTAVKKLRWAADPNGWFKKFLGLIFISLGIAILFGYDKDLETYLLNSANFGDISIRLEDAVREWLNL